MTGRASVQSAHGHNDKRFPGERSNGPGKSDSTLEPRQTGCRWIDPARAEGDGRIRRSMVM
jgi:hypothetical protein